MSIETRPMTVVDEVHTANAKTLQDMCNVLEKEIVAYIKILNLVTTEAAKKGITTERYQGYISIATGLKGQFDRLGDMLNLTITNFVEMIDKADSYLY